MVRRLSIKLAEETAMFTLCHTMPVNDREPHLTRAQIWQGWCSQRKTPCRLWTR